MLVFIDKDFERIYNNSMTKNAFIFAWHHGGIESIVPISRYEVHDRDNIVRILSDKEAITNPLSRIITSLLLRARFNSHRCYEIYAIDCDSDINEDSWWKLWEDDPQGIADLIRSRGHKLFSDRAETHKIKII
jgi:hypothetical protein